MCDSPFLCNYLCNLQAISERKLLKVNPQCRDLFHIVVISGQQEVEKLLSFEKIAEANENIIKRLVRLENMR